VDLVSAVIELVVRLEIPVLRRLFDGVSDGLDVGLDERESIA
jgi:hypothetical protein